MTGATEDLFTPIHKGLRAMMYDLSERLQSNDFEDLEATRRVVTDLEHDFEIARTAGCMICIFHRHADDEESQIFPAVRGSDAGLVETLIQEHHGLTRQELAITASGHELLGMPDAAQRMSAGIRLNQAMNALLADYVLHMNREERELVPHMSKHFTNEQLAAMRGRIIGGTPPDRVAAILTWMLPALNVTELTDFFGSLRASAPPPVFQALAKLGEARVDANRWRIVKARLAR